MSPGGRPRRGRRGGRSGSPFAAAEGGSRGLIRSGFSSGSFGCEFSGVPCPSARQILPLRQLAQHHTGGHRGEATLACDSLAVANLAPFDASLVSRLHYSSFYFPVRHASLKFVLLFPTWMYSVDFRHSNLFLCVLY